MRRPGEKADREIGRQAERAFGLARRPWLIRAGVTEGEIDQRVRTGVLRVEYPGIYRVGHRAPSVEASYLAAVWACGEGTRLSGQAAAYHWRLIRGKPPEPQVVAPKWRKVKGIKTSQRKLVPADGTTPEPATRQESNTAPHRGR